MGARRRCNSLDRLPLAEFFAVRINAHPKEILMAEPIPEKYLDLFKKPAFAHLATLMQEGSPQATPVWADYDGNYMTETSALRLLKDKNLPLDPPVTLPLPYPHNPH